MKGWTLGHRPALDGLRGLAVLLVMAFHWHLPFMGNGGRVGVLVFFVLSGFLITSLLVAEHKTTGRIDLRAFYIRRARRLIPALLMFLGVIAIAAVILGVWERVLPSVLAALFYAGYWVERLGGNLGIVSHTWTLSVEEQYYLVWPAVLIVGLTGRWFLVALFTGVVMLVMPATAGSLLAGSALGLWFGLREAIPVRPIIGVAALAGIVAVSATSPDVSTTVIVATVACSLVAIAASATHGIRLLELRPLRWTGKVSYALYLWHAPLAVAGVPLLPGVLLSFGLAALSWRVVESRFLRRVLPNEHPRSTVSVSLDPGRNVRSASTVLENECTSRRAIDGVDPHDAEHFVTGSGGRIRRNDGAANRVLAQLGGVGGVVERDPAESVRRAAGR